MPSDETTWAPISPRILCTVSQATNSTTNDTYRVVGSYAPTSLVNLNNLGLFTTSGSAPLGTVASQINPGDTSVVVEGYYNFPNTYPFDIQIGSEVMTVTSGNGINTWKVTRNTNGSSPTTCGIPVNTQIVGGLNTTNGVMFLKADFSTITLDAGSSIQFVIDLQFI